VLPAMWVQADRSRGEEAPKIFSPSLGLSHP